MQCVGESARAAAQVEHAPRRQLRDFPRHEPQPIVQAVVLEAVRFPVLACRVCRERRRSQKRVEAIMADAAYEIALRSACQSTGCFFIDETLLREKGVTDFSSYAVDPSSPLMQAFFLPEEENQSRVPHDLFLLNQ